MFEQWLRCNIFKGVFSDEVTVQIQPKEGKPSAFIVSRDQVVGEYDRAGQVRVRVYQEGSTSWAVLPTDNRTIIPVDESELVAP